jgi:hypothetical protein
MYVTNGFRNDGFGAQYQTIIYSAIFSQLINKKFCYTPFKSMEHNYDNDTNFLCKKELFINLINNFPLSSNLNNVEELNFLLSRHYVEHCIDNSVQTDIFKYIKHLFHTNKTPKFDKENKNIAVHIRKINKADNEGCYATHYEKDEYYLKSINRLRSLGEKKIFHIYSQGKIEEFESFKNEDVVFHLNESLEDTFYDLTTADTFIMSKGSFSYVAGLLALGEVYYLPFWHPKLNSWKVF